MPADDGDPAIGSPASGENRPDPAPAIDSDRVLIYRCPAGEPGLGGEQLAELAQDVSPTPVLGRHHDSPHQLVVEEQRLGAVAPLWRHEPATGTGPIETAPAHGGRRTEPADPEGSAGPTSGTVSCQQHSAEDSATE